MYIYRFVGYLLTGITIYNPLIYELSSKENLLDSLQFFFPFSPITWTRSIVGTKLYPPYFSKIESNDFFTRVSTKEKLAKSIEDDSFRGIILAKSLKTPNLEIGSSPHRTRRRRRTRRNAKDPLPSLVLSSRGSHETVSRSSSCPFGRVSGRLTKQFHVRAATRSEASSPLPSCLPPVICSRGFAWLALIAGQTRGTLRSLDNLLDDRPNRAVFLGRSRMDNGFRAMPRLLGVNWSFGSFHEW